MKRLPNGDFIFGWQKRYGGNMNLVQTSNDGTHLSDGHVWSNGPKDNPEKWLETNSTSYSIVNFQGMVLKPKVSH